MSPSGGDLDRLLRRLAGRRALARSAILFERTTFLVIATSSPPDGPEQADDLSSTRYERTSELIKALKHSCSRMREEFHALEMELPEFTAVLDGMTRNTYILLIVHDPTIGTMCLVRTRLSCNNADVHVCRDSGVKDKHPSCSAEV